MTAGVCGKIIKTIYPGHPQPQQLPSAQNQDEDNCCHFEEEKNDSDDDH